MNVGVHATRIRPIKVVPGNVLRAVISLHIFFFAPTTYHIMKHILDKEKVK